MRKIKLSRRIEILVAGRWTTGPGWQLLDQVHEYHELVVVERGAMQVTSAEGTITATTGDVLFYPKGVCHSEVGDPEKAPVLFFLTMQAAMRGVPGGIVRVADQRGRILELLRWIHSQQMRVAPISDIERKALVTALIEEFNSAVDDSEKTLSTATRNYIQEHIATPLTVDALAAEAGMSRSYFLSRYKAETGRTPMQDVREIRARYARQLIVGSQTPLKEVAVLAGLGTVQMLSHAFAKVFNRPPAQFRQSKSGKLASP